MADQDDSEYDYLIKIILLGDTNVGKTSFLLRYTEQRFDSNFKATVGIDFKKKLVMYEDTSSSAASASALETGHNSAVEIVDPSAVGESPARQHRLMIQIWDTAGQERFQSLCKAFVRDSMGFLVLFDVTNARSLMNVRNWLDMLHKNAYTSHPDVLLIGNKSDLIDEVKEQNAENAETGGRISTDVITGLSSEYAMPYIEVSAKNGTHIQESMDKLIDMIMQRIVRTREEVHGGKLVRQKPNKHAGKQKSAESKGCCG